MNIKLYVRFMNLNSQGQGRISLDIFEGLKAKGHNVIYNKCNFKDNLGYLYHSLIGKIFDFRKSDLNIALSSMDTFYLNPKKSIVIVHDLIPLLHQFTTLTHYNFSPHNQIGSLTFFYYTLRKAITFKKIICISEQTKTDLISVFPELDVNKIIVISNPIQKKYVPQKYNNNKRLRLYTISVLDYRKRSIELVKWFKKCNFKDVDLYIGGKGSLLSEMKELAFDYDTIKILGEIPEKDMVKRYKESDIVLFPTKNEGFGLPIVEGSCCKRLVITLKDGIIPKEVKECSLVANDWEDMETIINKFQKDNKCFNEIINSNTKKAKQFQVGYIDKIEKVIKDVI